MTRRFRALVLIPLPFSLLSSGSALGADPPSNADSTEPTSDLMSPDLATDPLGAELRDLMARLREARTRRWHLLELARQSSGERRRVFEEQAE